MKLRRGSIVFYVKFAGSLL